MQLVQRMETAQFLAVLHDFLGTLASELRHTHDVRGIAIVEVHLVD